MDQPVIGITAGNRERAGHPAVVLLRTYVDALIEAGGLPILVPSGLKEDGWQALYERLDGILFSGGGDIDPARYGATPAAGLALEVDPARDEVELGLARLAAADGKPWLGICRGAQAVNVALGGTLFLDIASEMPQALKHDYSSDIERSLVVHEIEVAGRTRLGEILGMQRLKTNSLHHQAARDLAPALRAAAHASDGVIEALELPGHPFGIAVQWHPECLPGELASRRLFQAFVAACRNG